MIPSSTTTLTAGEDTLTTATIVSILLGDSIAGGITPTILGDITIITDTAVLEILTTGIRSLTMPVEPLDSETPA